MWGQGMERALGGEGVLQGTREGGYSGQTPSPARRWLRPLWRRGQAWRCSQAALSVTPTGAPPRTANPAAPHSNPTANVSVDEPAALGLGRLLVNSEQMDSSAPLAPRLSNNENLLPRLPYKR